MLNLNFDWLKNNRKGVLDGVLDWWRYEKERKRSPVPRARFEAERDRWINGTDDLTPFCQVAVWWLEQRIAGMQV